MKNLLLSRSGRCGLVGTSLSRQLPLPPLYCNLTNMAVFFPAGRRRFQLGTTPSFATIRHERRKASSSVCSLFILYCEQLKRAPSRSGFSVLFPKFCIRSAGEDENRLPTASTCANLLKVPSLFYTADDPSSKLPTPLLYHTVAALYKREGPPREAPSSSLFGLGFRSFLRRVQGWTVCTVHIYH
jgi:HECT-domain (ubiquitin-transferase)